MSAYSPTNIIWGGQGWRARQSAVFAIKAIRCSAIKKNDSSQSRLYGYCTVILRLNRALFLLHDHRAGRHSEVFLLGLLFSRH